MFLPLYEADILTFYCCAIFFRFSHTLTIINEISKPENCLYAVLNLSHSPFFIIDDLLAVFEDLLLYIQISLLPAAALHG